MSTGDYAAYFGDGLDGYGGADETVEPVLDAPFADDRDDAGERFPRKEQLIVSACVGCCIVLLVHLVCYLAVKATAGPCEMERDTIIAREAWIDEAESVCVMAFIPISVRA